MAYVTRTVLMEENERLRAEVDRLQKELNIARQFCSLHREHSETWRKSINTMAVANERIAQSLAQVHTNERMSRKDGERK